MSNLNNLSLSSFSSKKFTLLDSNSLKIDFTNCKQSSEVFDEDYTGTLSQLKIFMLIAGYLHFHIGYIPRILKYHAPNSIVMQYVGNQTLLNMGLNSAKYGIFRSALEKAVLWLVKLHKFDAVLPPDIVIQRYYSIKSMKKEIGYIVKNNELDSIIECIYTSQYNRICHRDFQSANILYHDKEIYVVDFQDACMGPVLYDLASLLYDLKISLSETEVKHLAELYLENMKEHWPEPEVFWQQLKYSGLIRLLKSLAVRYRNPGLDNTCIEIKRGKVLLERLLYQCNVSLDLDAFPIIDTDKRFGLVTILLAAGQGKRMGGDLPKVLQPCLDRPMLDFSLRLANMIPSDRTYLVVGYQSDKIYNWIDSNDSLSKELIFVRQDEQLGTGHAVKQVVPLIDHRDDIVNVLTMAGDVPVLDYNILKEFIDAFNSNTEYAAGVLTTDTPKPMGCGRIMRDSNGLFSGTIEQKDIPEDRTDLLQIKEISSGTLLFRKSLLVKYLELIQPNNKQNEYYLPDVINLLHKDGYPILAHKCERIPEIHGANTKEQLHYLEEWMST
jgi:CTP:molybdopterin cytidylyltransferase MocA